MPMLAFLPWLRIPSPIRAGLAHAFPLVVGESPEGIALDISPDTLKKVLSQYRRAAHLPLHVMTVIQWDERPVGCEFDEWDQAAIFKFGQHLAVTGLSNRRFLGGLDDYTASGHYQIVIQAFAEPFRGGVNLTHRRKGGGTNVYMGQSDVHFILPGHLVGQGRPSLNLPFLHALHGSQRFPDSLREHVDASVTQFLLSNSDSPDVPPDVETSAAYSALERLVDGDDIADVRGGLLELFAAFDAAPAATRLRTELPAFDPGRPEFRRWIGQLYRVRGRLAHGKAAEGYKSDWSTFEHGVAAAFLYPLMLKSLLEQHKLYTITDEDVAHAVGVESLLGDRPFYAVRSEDDLDEFERDPRARAGWTQQFEAINSALLVMWLSGTIETAYTETNAREN